MCQLEAPYFERYKQIKSGVSEFIYKCSLIGSETRPNEMCIAGIILDGVSDQITCGRAASTSFYILQLQHRENKYDTLQARSFYGAPGCCGGVPKARVH